jgi:hypothetical protein
MVEAATEAALAHATAQGIRGAAVTPFLLADVQARTKGASVQANLALLEANAALAAEIAVALVTLRAASSRSPFDGGTHGSTVQLTSREHGSLGRTQTVEAVVSS